MTNDSLGKITRFVCSVLTSLFIFWMSFGVVLQPTIEVVAKESFKRMLKAQGIDPEVFKTMQTDISGIGVEVSSMKAQIDKTVRQTDSLEKDTASTKCIAQKLLNLQLGLSSSPGLC